MPAVVALALYTVVLARLMVFKDLPTIRVGAVMLDFAGTNGGHPPNVVPFATILSYLRGDSGAVIAVVNIIGNVVILIPFGAILSVLNDRRAMLGLGLLAGLTIETAQQVLNVGVFDIDDVILNALGVIAGYAMLRVLSSWASPHPTTRLVAAATLATACIAVAIAFAYRSNVRLDFRHRSTVLADPSTSVAVGPATPSTNRRRGPDLCGGTGGTGQIIAADAATITIRRSDGVVQVLRIAEHAQIRNSDGPASASSLRIGDHVTVVVNDADTASTVLVCTTPDVAP